MGFLDVAVNTQTILSIEPLFDGKDAFRSGINLAPNVVYGRGQVLGLVSASANDVQTVTLSNGQSGDTFTVTVEYPLNNKQTTAAIAYNAASTTTVTAAVQLLSNVGPGNCLVTGSAGGPFTFTFAGTLAHIPIPVMTATITNLGGTEAIAVVHTTTGATADTMAKYDSTVLTAPSAAPTVAVGTVTTDPPIADVHSFSYTYYNAQGETTPSPAIGLAADGAHEPAISSIAIPTGATGIRYYVDGVQFKQLTTAGATTLKAATLAAATGLAPTSNTAYTIPNGAGTSKAVCILKHDCAVDTAGQITLGTVATGGPWGETVPSTVAFFSGTFATADLTGLDAKAVTDLGARLIQGSTSSGTIRIP